MSGIIRLVDDTLSLTDSISNTNDIKKVNLIILNIRNIKKKLKIQKSNAIATNSLFLSLYSIAYKIITNHLTISTLYLRYLISYKLEYLEKIHIKKSIINNLFCNFIKCIEEI